MRMFVVLIVVIRIPYIFEMRRHIRMKAPLYVSWTLDGVYGVLGKHEIIRYIIRTLGVLRSARKLAKQSSHLQVRQTNIRIGRPVGQAKWCLISKIYGTYFPVRLPITFRRIGAGCLYLIWRCVVASARWCLWWGSVSPAPSWCCSFSVGSESERYAEDIT